MDQSTRQAARIPPKLQGSPCHPAALAAGAPRHRRSDYLHQLRPAGKGACVCSGSSGSCRDSALFFLFFLQLRWKELALYKNCVQPDTPSPDSIHIPRAVIPLQSCSLEATPSCHLS